MGNMKTPGVYIVEKNGCTITTLKATAPRSSRYNTATSPSSDSSRRWKRNTPCSARRASRSAPN